MVSSWAHGHKHFTPNAMQARAALAARLIRAMTSRYTAEQMKSPCGARNL